MRSIEHPWPLKPCFVIQIRKVLVFVCRSHTRCSHAADPADWMANITPTCTSWRGSHATRNPLSCWAAGRPQSSILDRNANLSYALLTEASAVDTLDIPVPCSLLDSGRVVSLALGFLHAASQRWAFMRRSSYLNLAESARSGRHNIVSVWLESNESKGQAMHFMDNPLYCFAVTSILSAEYLRVGVKPPLAQYRYFYNFLFSAIAYDRRLTQTVS